MSKDIEIALPVPKKTKSNSLELIVEQSTLR